MRNVTYHWLLLGLILPAFAAASASEQQWLRYYTGRENHQILGNICSQQIYLTAEKPIGIEIPEFNSNEPLFGKWLTPMVDSGRVWVALDRSKKDGPYDKLFIDSNLNDNLSDETVVEAYQAEPNRSNFGPVKVVFQIEEGPAAYHLNFEFSSHNNRHLLSATSGCWYEGIISVNGQAKYCMLIDQNANGTFNDKSENEYECDRIGIGDKNNLKTNFVGNQIVIGAEIFQIQIPRDGSFIKCMVDDNIIYGKITLPENIYELELQKDNRLFTIEPEKGAGRIPVGRYRINLWRIKRDDEHGNTWILTGKDFGNNGQFDVYENEPANLDIGEPLRCEMQIKKSRLNYSFNQVLLGKLNEKIELNRNGFQAQPPKLNIKNATNTYNRTYSFEYG